MTLTAPSSPMRRLDERRSVWTSPKLSAVFPCSAISRSILASAASSIPLSSGVTSGVSRQSPKSDFEPTMRSSSHTIRSNHLGRCHERELACREAATRPILSIEEARPFSEGSFPSRNSKSTAYCSAPSGLVNEQSLSPWKVGYALATRTVPSLASASIQASSLSISFFSRYPGRCSLSTNRWESASPFESAEDSTRYVAFSERESCLTAASSKPQWESASRV